MMDKNTNWDLLYINDGNLASLSSQINAYVKKYGKLNNVVIWNHGNTNRLKPFGTCEKSFDGQFSNTEVSVAKRGEATGKVKKFTDGIKILAENMGVSAKMVFVACLSGSMEFGDQSFAESFGSYIQSFNKNLKVYFPNGLTKFYKDGSRSAGEVYRDIALPFDEPLSYPSNPTWTEVSNGRRMLKKSLMLKKRGQALKL